MGSIQFGVNQYKGLYSMMVFLNKTNFYPGETIRGEIKLYLKNNSQNAPQILNNPVVSYTLVHREYWQNHDYVQSNSKASISNSNIQTASSSIIISDEGNVSDDIKHLKEDILFSKKEVYTNLLNNTIQYGITIPFQILIPEKARPSLEFLHTAKIYAYSRTILNIELPDYGNEAKLLIFIQKSPTNLKSDLTITKSVTKKKLGIFGSGNNVNFQGSYPKNAYGFNEVCPIDIKIDTFGSKESIKNISVTLKRKVLFIDNIIKSFLKINEYVDDLWNNSMSSFPSSQDFKFNIPLNESNKIFIQRKSLFVDLNSISKQSLICLLPSYEGQLIKCEYFISVKVAFDSLLIKDPEFIMPLDIGHTPTLFVQNCMFDVNKILSNYNGNMNMALMIPDILVNKNNIKSNINNNTNINNSNNINVQYNMSKIFGVKDQNIINNKQQNIKKIFGEVKNNNSLNNNNNIMNNNNKNIINKNNNSLSNNNQIYEKETPEGEINYQKYIDNQYNPYQNINLENSGNLPTLEELNNAKNEQAAPPGLTPDP